MKKLILAIALCYALFTFSRNGILEIVLLDVLAVMQKK
jgi:hypothetical protein